MMAVYMFSFIVILWKMKKNDEQSKLAEKADEAVFTWKVFTSWDYGIADVEAAHNKVAAAVQHSPLHSLSGFCYFDGVARGDTGGRGAGEGAAAGLANHRQARRRHAVYVQLKHFYQI